ncbi:MAG: PAS domain-containing protein [Verrucomicrobiota bacterium]
MEPTSNLWKLLWDYDPNGLLVLDSAMNIRLVNQALCRMLKSDAQALVGRNAMDILGDVRDFQRAYQEHIEILGQEQAFPQFDLYVRKVIFPVPGEKVVACIFVDMTREWKQRLEMKELKRQAIQEVRQVVDKQMNVAQEIAGLLGESTAETKVSLLHLLEMLQRENA